MDSLSAIYSTYALGIERAASYLKQEEVRTMTYMDMQWLWMRGAESQEHSSFSLQLFKFQSGVNNLVIYS